MSAQLAGKISVKHSYALLAISEAFVMLSCLFLSMRNSMHSFLDHMLCLSCITFVIIGFLGMAAMGLYHARQRGTPSEQVARIFLSFTLVSVAEGIFFYTIPMSDIQPQGLILALVLSFVLICVLRYGFTKLHTTGLFKHRALVLGAGERACIIQDGLRRASDRKGFNLLGYVKIEGDACCIRQQDQLTVDLEHLFKFVQHHKIEEVILAADQHEDCLPMGELLASRLAGIHVIDIASFIERESGKIPLKLLPPSWMACGRGYRISRNVVRMGKRLFDIFISLFLLILVWPIMLITALLIRLEGGSGAPILYQQTRVGFRGEPFEIFKFRSMKVNAENDGAVWARKGDQRVTPVGAFIRKYRIDELPQLFNILHGEMSFIGPRPERPEFVDKLSRNLPYYDARHQVKPGLTGWAQICYSYGSNEEEALEKLQYDLYYVKNFSFLLDTIIMVQTVEVILFGKGAR
uniref:TIGR03013 family XrtA/PEP-CTERM system glycosyltransferase n=1 Tax=Marinobacterium profundum TaxID=1714300 RepID=UPI00082BC6C2|nr:TIGR03013 family XrtA/PEP-CTERM system glycosyltransferase [Marinobacterium profundum]